jgi:anti-anti-sigma factor
VLPEIPFAMSASLSDGILIITLGGELDITVRAALAEQLGQILEQRPLHLVYDLTEVPYIDAGTLCLLVQAARCTPHKPELVCPSPLVARLLQVTRLDAECTITGTRPPASSMALAADDGQTAGASATTAAGAVPGC